MGQVWLAAGSRAGGTPAAGQLLSIAANPALYSLLGTMYGGNGTTTFALPDLRNAAPNGLTYVICTQGYYPTAE
ncbi:MAG: phage tail protein [Rhodocyclaceae bacterium]